jgi:hypothetical protein
VRRDRVLAARLEIGLILGHQGMVEHLLADSSSGMST